MKKIWNGFNDIISIFSGGMLAFVMVIICLDVAMRLLLNAPIMGVVPLVTVLIPALVFLPFADTEIHDHHLRVELISTLVSEKWQFVFDLLAALIGIFYVSVMTWVFWPFAMSAYEGAEYLPGLSRIRTWPSKFAMLLGAGFFVIQFTINIWNILKKVKTDFFDK